MAVRFIIPAAGNSVRFGGVYKELLPISRGACGLSYAVAMATKLGQCEPVVVTTLEKQQLHEEAIVSRGLRARFVVKTVPEEGDMWGSVLLGLDRSMGGGIIMPDTVPVVEYPDSIRHSPITFGCFPTNSPWRFSCLDVRDGRPAILTKPAVTAPMLAWGIVLWDEESSTTLAAHQHFDRAFESIMRERGYGWFLLSSYEDLGTFEDYRRYMSSGEPERMSKEEPVIIGAHRSHSQT